MARPRVADGGDCLQIWRAGASRLNKQSRTVDKWWPSRFGVGRERTIPHRKKKQIFTGFTLESSYEQGNEPSGTINGGEFLE